MATLLVNKEGVRFNGEQLIEMISISCCECGILFAMTSDFNKECREQSGKLFHCPNGHGQHYSKSISDGLRDELKKKGDELKRKEQDLSEKTLENFRLSNELTRTSGTLETTKKKLKKVERRITNGVCPCCNRSFINLQCHMLAKHPEQVKKQ